MMKMIEDDIEKLKHQFQCYQEGLRARFLGLTIDKSPYEPRTYMADAWEDGWGLVDHYMSQPLIYRSAKYQFPIDDGDNFTESIYHQESKIWTTNE